MYIHVEYINRKVNMNIIKSNPLYGRVSRDEFLTPFDRIFDDFYKSFSPNFSKEFGVDFFEKGAYPKINVTEYDNSVVIEAGVPGLTKSDVSVEIESGTLTITGNKVIKSNVDEKICNSYRELKHSSFIRSFSLSENIDTNTVDAKVENGLLTIKLNKIKPTNVSQKKKINIS